MQKILINILLIISIYLLYIAFFTDKPSICQKSPTKEEKKL